MRRQTSSPQTDDRSGPLRPVLVDGRKVHGDRTGVGHYTASILRHWPKGDEVDVLVSEKLDSAFGESTHTVLGPGPLWHLRAAFRALSTGAVYFSPESLIVPWLLGRRAIITVHDLTPVTNPSVHTARNLLIHRLLLRSALRRVRAIIVPTNAVLQDLQNCFPESAHKAKVVYEGVRNLDYEVASAEAVALVRTEKPYVLYVGTIEPRKNVSALIEAFLECAPEEWHLLLAGRIGWLDQDELAMFSEQLAHDRVIHLGFVPDDWLPTLYLNCGLFAYVSGAEGFGLPVAEAMAAGALVMHTDDPALLEVGGDAGIVVDRSRLATSLRESLKRALSLSEADRLRFIQAGYVASGRFDWSRAARATRDLVHGIS